MYVYIYICMYIYTRTLTHDTHPPCKRQPPKPPNKGGLWPLGFLLNSCHKPQRNANKLLTNPKPPNMRNTRPQACSPHQHAHHHKCMLAILPSHASL